MKVIADGLAADTKRMRNELAINSKMRNGQTATTGRAYTGLKILGLVLSIILAAGLPQKAQAQYYFGKNKIQYTQFDWQVMTTEHFRIYFYTEANEIAEMAGYLAEESYDSLSARFNHEVRKKIPLIIYSAPAYFAQTNILPFILPESVGGFTEYLKGRVVVPFYGSYFSFKHVIRHELVHVFTHSKISSILSRRVMPRYATPPLWFTEGLAEFWSGEWDSQADMVVKDMVLSGNILPIPRLWQIRGSYMTYKLGQSICAFIDQEYGEDKLLRLFENWPKARRFKTIVKLTLGDDLNELSRKWEYYLKKRYYPELDSLGLVAMEAEQLTHDGYAESAVPIRYDDGQGERDWIVFKANRMGYSGLYMKEANGSSHDWITLLKGERSADFESLHFLRSSIDATNEGLVLFSSKSSETDVINLYDIKKRGVIKSYRHESLVSARSPRFSPDRSQVVFVGIGKNGRADLYLLELKSGQFTRLTDDTFYDRSPVFAKNSSKVIFASDRGAFGNEGAFHLWEVELRSLKLTQLTYGNHKDITPEVSSRGIYFCSDRRGSFNLYRLDPEGNLTRHSSLANGAFSPRESPEGDKMVINGYQNWTYSVYQLDLAQSPELVARPPSSPRLGWKPTLMERQKSHATMRYDTEYSFDIAQSSIAYDQVYGSLGGIQAAMSDVLGDKAYYFVLSNTAATKDEFVSSFNFGLTHINKKRRLRWGVGIFHLYDEYRDEFTRFYDEREAGILGLISYPLSKFHRVELSTTARYSKRDPFLVGATREALLVTHSLRWIFDNALWDITGPIEGRRYNFSVGMTYSVNDGRSFARTALIDVRHYLRLGRTSALANRMFGYTSTGLEPQRMYLGGSWTLRGYSRRAFYNRNVILGSTELRFPLIDNLLIGFPFGGLGFRGIRGALFFDVGSGWEDEYDRLYGAYGAGFRVALGYVVVLRFDFTRTTDFHSVSPNTDFDFFFGWNF